MTPYAVDNKGGGTYQVLIYDNNWPGQTRAITFDTKADTWTYAAASQPGRTRLRLRGGRSNQDAFALSHLARIGHPTVPVLRQGTDHGDLQGG